MRRLSPKPTRGTRSGFRAAALGVCLAVLSAAPAAAGSGSLYSGPGPRPGPDILYEPPANSPQLGNEPGSVWNASPILVSGSSAYRGGEFLYQDYLYDDYGANGGLRDPADPSNGDQAFSMPNGSYTYPSNDVYDDNAADFVEMRVKPLDDATAFRITYNTMNEGGEDKVATTIAIGNSALERQFPHGANARAPAEKFLTVHGETAELRDADPASTAAPVTFTAKVNLERRQVEVLVPHSAWNPGSTVVPMRAGTGLWGSGRYITPKPIRSATDPGGSGLLPTPTAFFNAAFRFDEPQPDPTDLASTSTSPAWWRDRRQGEELRTGNMTPFVANVDFGKLEGQDPTETDDDGVPTVGPLNRIVASHYEPDQGKDFNRQCSNPDECKGEIVGQLQPYSIYVPPGGAPADGFGLSLLLHSLGANYNQYSDSKNQSQIGNRNPDQRSIVITPTGRGPDGFYYDLAGADTFEVWADVARHYDLDPEYTVATGYSMGGYGTFKFATRYPDLFAKAQTTVGPPGLGYNVEASNPVPGGPKSSTFRMLASVRNVPFLMWAAQEDELVPFPSSQQQANRFDELGYRYIFDVFKTATHLTLAINDEYAPVAAFLGDTQVDRDPHHVTYTINPTMDFPDVKTVGDHAYWLSRLRVRDEGGEAPLGTIDVRSEGFGRGDAPPQPTALSAGVLTGGTFGALAFREQSKAWGPEPSTTVRDRLNVRAQNVSSVTVNPARARVTCDAELAVTSDGPLTVILEGCGRSESFSGARSSDGGNGGNGGNGASADPDPGAAPGAAPTSPRRCLPSAFRLGARGIGPVRLGHRRGRVAALIGAAAGGRPRTLATCLTGGGRLVAAFSRRGDARLVATTAPALRVRGIRVGSSARRIARAYGAVRSMPGRAVSARSGSTRLLFGVRRGRVSYIAVVDRRLLKRPALLRPYLRSARLR